MALDLTVRAKIDVDMAVNMETITLEEMIEEHTWKNEKDKRTVIKLIAKKKLSR